MKGKVSIITPCYNDEKFKQIYINNIKRQDYDSVEIIFVNDGSVNDISLMIQEIEKVTRDKGYEFVFLSKDNGGAASAVNLALKYVTGDYIMLLDMDDELFENAVSSMAGVLNSHFEIDTIISNGYYVFEGNKRKQCRFIKGNKVDKNKIFERLLMMKFYNWPGSYMIRAVSFFEINKGKDIYISPYGQNMQILIPATYEKKIYFLDEYLMKYYVRIKSVSHTGDKNRMQELLDGYERIRREVVKKICHSIEERDYYLRLINVASVRKKLYFACKKRDKFELQKQYKMLKNLNSVRILDFIRYVCGQNLLMNFAYKVIDFTIERITNRVI